MLYIYNLKIDKRDYKKHAISKLLTPMLMCAIKQFTGYTELLQYERCYFTVANTQRVFLQSSWSQCLFQYLDGVQCFYITENSVPSFRYTKL